jgi:ABC-type Zn2+ transport system substrate-binding protein/surface adhesin
MGCCGGNMHGHNNHQNQDHQKTDDQHQHENKLNIMPILSIAAIGIIVVYFFKYIV